MFSHQQTCSELPKAEVCIRGPGSNSAGLGSNSYVCCWVVQPGVGWVGVEWGWSGVGVGWGWGMMFRKEKP